MSNALSVKGLTHPNDARSAPGHSGHVPSNPLADICAGALSAQGPATTLLEQFLAEPVPGKALALWLSRHSFRTPPTKEQIARILARDIARLDALLSRQINAILHHPAFQKLEARWRGLRYLIEQVPEGCNIKVRVLSITWKELTRDLERALEFDQSQLFQKVYEEEFGTPGGTPFSVLLGDYEVRHRPAPDSPTDDIQALMGIASVAAAAFAPFITAAHPSVLALDRFTDLERPLALPRTFEQVEYLRWRVFRQSADARFVGLTLPRVLMRLPYGDNGRVDGFRFREEVGALDRSEYLWGSAIYAFASILVRGFADYGWLANIRGVPDGPGGGGVVTGLPVHSFCTDRTGVAPRSSTDALITDFQEKELGELGFIPLCHCPDTELCAFFGNQSVQRPQQYDQPAATANARLSAMLQYMLCVSRFAHYLKVIARDKIGSFAGPSDCEEYLHRWLLDYTLADDKADPETRARYPLREFRVQIREHPAKPGTYLGVFQLRPHFQLDQVSSAVRLVTELAPAQSR
ncbi:MAG: type VI secretion system contractile sheath large subunit [Gemmataceae bacterium]|nr:type VI secretion system contractile sheath large subunit [Gemmataceae bacterium]